MDKDKKVKDKSVAPVQITAEQLIREAAERLGGEGRAKRIYVDKGDFQEYRQQLRRQCEDALRRNRGNIATWLRYARFEMEQQDYARARSIYERALDVDPRNTTLWLKYAEMEATLKNVNLARNVWDRAVTVLPRMDAFWFKYLKMEEMLGEVDRATEVWNRWLSWEPEDQIFLSAAKFEVKHGRVGKARERFDRLVSIRPDHIQNWILFAHFEEDEAKDATKARSVYERALDGLDTLAPKLFIEFAKFEVRQREIERARAIYKLGLERFPADTHPGLYHSYAQFEKAHGDPDTIDMVVFYKRRKEYERRLLDAPLDHDTWHELTQLLITSGASEEEVVGAFEKAVGNVPPIREKRYWRRYVFLWLFYALYCEKDLSDRSRAIAVMKRALEIIPHSAFTFAKLWQELAEMHIRNLDVVSARKAFGMAIGLSQGRSSTVFRKYLEMEMQLREFDRARLIYQRWLECMPSSSNVWLKWSELERLLQDDERARQVYELAIEEPEMDMPEVLWKAFIDFEYELGQHDRIRALYERLLLRTEHLKVWISYASFEANAGEMSNARAILERASKVLTEYVEERVLLFQAWLELEQTYGDDESISSIQARQPRMIKKKRQVPGQTEWEEFNDYLFPDDDSTRATIKLLEMAQSWKATKSQ